MKGLTKKTWITRFSNCKLSLMGQNKVGYDKFLFAFIKQKLKILRAFKIKTIVNNDWLL